MNAHFLPMLIGILCNKHMVSSKAYTHHLRGHHPGGMQDAIAFQRNRNYTGCGLEFNKTHLCTVFTQMAVMELQAAALMILVDSLATSVNTLCLSVEHRSADCISRSTPPIIEATESSVFHLLTVPISNSSATQYFRGYVSR